ncbi:MAG: alkaline phosphatase family protein [Planctomycetota bacterium]|jgi:predicted AlkP superfamily phosphohydrolase/phosphomutase
MSDRLGAEPRFDRCIILGMDGLDPQIVAALMGQNKLPNFAKLANDGTFGPLRTSNPAMSPVAWSNIATGAGPSHHGIFDFLHRDPRDYMPYISLRKSSHGVFGTRYERARQVDGFWKYTSDAGLPTTVLRWPVTFPPEKTTGRFLSGLGVPDLLGTEGQYTFYATEPVARDDPSPHNVVRVRWDRAEAGTIRAVLKGPMIGRGRAAEVPLIARMRGPKVGSLQFGSGPAVEIRRGKWTPWIGITFKARLSRINGMVKLLLLEAEPQFRLLVSPINLDPANPAFDLSCPAKYARSLRDRIGVFHTLGMPEMVHPLSHRRYGFDEFLAQVQAVRTERRAMFLDELERFDKGVFAFVFDHTDRIQHAFWATRDPAHPMYDPTDAQSYRRVIEDTYGEMDACLGEASKRIDGKTLLMTVSDHGFGSFRRQVHLNRWLVDNGFMHLKGPQDAEGQGLFQDVDWDNTQAYAVGFSSIYLNLAGREGGGIVGREKQSRGLLKDISSRLQTLVDPAAGNRVIHRAYLGGLIYTDGPLVDKGPDIVVGFEPGYRASWQTALGGAPTKLVEDNKSRWSGDHIFDPDLVPGIILSNAGLGGQPYRGIDVAPTVLGCLGLAKPGHMVGRDLLLTQ